MFIDNTIELNYNIEINCFFIKFHLLFLNVLPFRKQEMEIHLIKIGYYSSQLNEMKLVTGLCSCCMAY